MARRRGRKRSSFVPALLVFAVLAACAGWLLRDRMDEALLSLLLMSFVPAVIVAWTADAWRDGEALRQPWRTFNLDVRRVTRKDNPLSYWTQIVLSLVFAAALLAFVAVGIWLRLSST